MAQSNPNTARPASSAPTAAPTSYRDPSVEEDDDDLDDLDDVLASFNTHARPSAASSSQAVESSSIFPPSTAPASGTDAPQPGETDGDGDDDFEASLVEGMESLLRQLAGEHPPGPAADSKAKDPAGQDTAGHPGLAGGTGGLSKEEEEKAWQKALEMMLSGEGLAAMGLDDKQHQVPGPASPKGKEKAASAAPSSAAPAPAGAPAAQAGAKPAPPASFEETMKRTLESLNTAGQNKGQSKGAGGAGGGGQPDLEALLASLGGDSDLLKNLKDLGLDGEDGQGGEDGLADVLEGMMAQLMTKEVLEEPMSELAAKYPPYLASPPSDISPADLEKYRQQNLIVQQILRVFKKPGYNDERDGKEVARLVGEMQDLGGPPKEVMGDLPEGFDLGALGSGEEGCTIM